MRDTTAIIVTFNRPDSLKILVKSIRKYCPDLKVIIVDNGEKESSRSYSRMKNVEYYKVEFDSGLSYSRNFAVDRVKTKYMILLDDDFEFTEKTDINEMIRILELGFDIVGGSVEQMKFDGLLERDGKTLKYVEKNRGSHEGYPLYDIILNFFIAKTDVIKKIRWDEELKLAEHTDFFLRAKDYNIKITYTPDIQIRHNHDRSIEYSKFRSRGKDYMWRFMEKQDIDCIINFVGNKTFIYNKIPQEVKIIDEKQRMIKRVDFCITTFKRPLALKNLLMSIAKYYPVANVYVADQDETLDREYYKELRIELYNAGLAKRVSIEHLPYDCGLSYARNHLVTTTPNMYKLILDDDFEFTEETDITKMIKLFEANPSAGIVGGKVRQLGHDIHFEFTPEKIGDTLYHRGERQLWKTHSGIKYRRTGSVLNFALFKRDVFRNILWDPELKLSEHTDFYLRLKGTPWQVLYTPDVIVEHPQADKNREYKKYRTRDKFTVKMLKKHGVNKMVYQNGQTIEVTPDNKLINYKSTPKPI